MKSNLPNGAMTKSAIRDMMTDGVERVLLTDDVVEYIAAHPDVMRIDRVRLANDHPAEKKHVISLQVAIGDEEGKTSGLAHVHLSIVESEATAFDALLAIVERWCALDLKTVRNVLGINAQCEDNAHEKVNAPPPPGNLTH